MRSAPATWTLVGVIATSGCHADAVPHGRAFEGAERGPSGILIDAVPAAGTMVGSSSMSGKIDPEQPVDTQSRIVDQRTIEVDGKPACALTVRYANAVDQPVTWNGQSCPALTIGFASYSDLAEMDKLRRRPVEALEDLKRDHLVAVLRIENDVTASIYPLNVAGLVCEVIVAD